MRAASEGTFLVVRKHRELRRPRRHRAVSGDPGDFEVVLERQEQVAAMTGELPDQELVEHVSVQGRVGGQGAGGGVRNDHVRGVVRGGR